MTQQQGFTLSDRMALTSFTFTWWMDLIQMVFGLSVLLWMTLMLIITYNMNIPIILVMLPWKCWNCRLVSRCPYHHWELWITSLVQQAVWWPPGFREGSSKQPDLNKMKYDTNVTNSTVTLSCTINILIKIVLVFCFFATNYTSISMCKYFHTKFLSISNYVVNISKFSLLQGERKTLTNLLQRSPVKNLYLIINK